MKLEKIGEYWDEKYKQSIIYGSKELEILKSIIKYKRSGTVLDLGCGPGHNSLMLAKFGFKVTSIDASKYALDYLNNQNNPNITTILSDFNNIPNKKYDVIVATRVLHFLQRENAIELINKIKEHTKINGLNIFFCITNEGDFYKNKKNRSHFYPKQDEFFKIYKDWDILEFHMSWGTASQTIKNKVQRNKSFFIIARKK